MYTSIVPILAYHEICELPGRMNKGYSYNVTPCNFRNQMEFLYTNNYSVIKLEDFVCFLRERKEVPAKSLVITFDDGYRNSYTDAFPVLKRYSFPATVFLATDYIGKSGMFPWLNGFSNEGERLIHNWIPLTWTEIREMSEGGITFGSHSGSHRNLREMNKTDFEKEIERSKNIIEEETNRRVNLFSYPFSFPKYRGRYREVINGTKEVLLKRKFLGACTTIIGTNTLRSDPFCLRRIQIRNTDSLFSFRAKVDGAYNWVGMVQKAYQRIIEPVIERRR